MKLNSFIGRVILAMVAVLVFIGLYMISYQYVKHTMVKKYHIAQVREDPIPTILQSIVRKGKLVVTDANVSASTVTKMDSSIWDASVTSTEKARIQVFLNLSNFKQEWIKRNGNTINIFIPHINVESEVIPTEIEHKTNGSWGFVVNQDFLNHAKQENRDILKEQLNSDAFQLAVDGDREVEYQLTNLLTTLVSNQGMTVNVKVVE